MKVKTLSIFLLFFLLIPGLALAEKSNKSKQPKVNKVEGCIIKGNKATLKPGYEFVKKPDNKVDIKKIGEDSIGGTFGCYCAEGGSGSCDLLITGNSIDCVKDSCSTNCRLTVIVKQPAK